MYVCVYSGGVPSWPCAFGVICLICPHLAVDKELPLLVERLAKLAVL